MTFTPIDRRRWDREEYFNYFLNVVPCMYSMTMDLDVTPIMKRKERPYPAMLYFLSVVENHHKRYRMALSEKGELGYLTWSTPAIPYFIKMTIPFPACGQSTAPPMTVSSAPTRTMKPATGT